MSRDDRDDRAVDPTNPDAAALRDWLQQWVADAVGIDIAEVGLERPLDEFGLSSRSAVALSGELEDLLGKTLPTTLVWDHPTIARLAQSLTESPDHAPAPAEQQRPESAASRPGATDVAGSRNEPIAIVGVGCRLPGDANTPEQFWQLILGGTDAIGPVPADRWPGHDGPPMRGGFLSDVAGFDAEFFGIAPREATSMDPQQRLLLEVAWEALEHAGIAPTSLRGSATGVFVGVSGVDYALRTTSDANEVDAWTPTGVATSITANRLSYLLDLRGPSLAVDTACSSSLVAVHQACRALHWGDCDTALAAGVNLLLHPAITTAFSEAGALSADGRCKAFDAAADGIARGEGCGVIVLKRLSDAQRNGDTVLAVVRGSAVNQDGRSNGLTAPNPGAQIDLLHQAYADADLVPGDVDYVEAHGTGTLLGDPIEANALGTVLGKGRPASRPLLLGSVKTNIGHLEAAAGITGLIKVVLAMRHGQLPPSLHFHHPNPHIGFEEHRLRVVTGTTPWPRRSGRATAGISGFGFGGTNAHIVLEEAPVSIPPGCGAEPETPAVLMLSAQSAERLRDAAQDLGEWLDTSDGHAVGLPAVGHALGRRAHQRYRAAVVARDRKEALEGLRALAGEETARGLVTGVAGTETTAPVWVFSGYGSQWQGMGATLLAEEPMFRAAIDELEPLVAREAGFSLRGVLEREERITGVDRTQVVIFGVQVGLARLLRHYGVTPAAVIGHSMGEVAAAHAAGALGLADAVRVIAVRSRLMESAAGEGSGAMGAVGLSEEEFAELAPRFPKVSIAVHAAPNALTIAGDTEQVKGLVAHAEKLGRMARVLDVAGAGHTAAVDPILGELAAELADISAVAPEVPVYSTVLSEPRRDPGHGAFHWGGYWVAGARRPVRFAQAVAAAIADGHRAFVELAPHPIAAPAVAGTAAAGGVFDPLIAVTMRRGADDPTTFRTALASLHVHGCGGNPDLLHPPAPLPELPRTRWRHIRYWAAATNGASLDVELPGAHVELPDGSHAWQLQFAADPEHLIAAAATAVLGESEVCDLVLHSTGSGAGRMTTTLHSTGRGADIKVHARDGEDWVLVASARAARVTKRVTKGRPRKRKETVGDRLRSIVAGVMGFAPDQIDPHVPLVELGLDSLMAVRIKNIVEHELGTPPLVLGMLRGAGLADLDAHITDLLGSTIPAPAPIGPRDATERLLLREWAGAPSTGVTDEITDHAEIRRLAARLGDRLGKRIDPDELISRRTLAGMADLLRDDVEGAAGTSIVRVLQPAPRRGAQAPLFLFHPAGGPCSVYQPLIDGLGEQVPCYGFERVEGELSERVDRYLPVIREIAGDGPYRLAGWSFGGALAYEMARRLDAAGADVELVALIDTVMPEPDGIPAAQADMDRWRRFARFVERTYGQPLPLPMGELAEADEEHQLDIVMGVLENTGLGMSPGVLRHQRTSWIDSRVAERHRPEPYGGRVVLYRAQAMHEDAVELDPRYGNVGPDGGWGGLAPAMEIVPVSGDHLAVIDPPCVSAVAEDLRARLAGELAGRRTAPRFRS